MTDSDDIKNYHHQLLQEESRGKIEGILAQQDIRNKLAEFSKKHELDEWSILKRRLKRNNFPHYKGLLFYCEKNNMGSLTRGKYKMLYGSMLVIALLVLL